MLYVKGFLVALQGVPVTVGVTLIAMVTRSGSGPCPGADEDVQDQGLNCACKLIHRNYPRHAADRPGFDYGLRTAAAVAVQRHFLSLAVFDYPRCYRVRLNSAAYVAEVIRSGIQAVDKGQMEAARSIGMTRAQAMKLIVIPQALKIVLPSFGNEFVSLIKETSVLSYVGVVEILRKGALWNAATFNTFEAYIGVALVYMLLTIPSSKLVNILRKKWRISMRNNKEKPFLQQ